MNLQSVAVMKKAYAKEKVVLENVFHTMPHLLRLKAFAGQWVYNCVDLIKSILAIAVAQVVNLIGIILGLTTVSRNTL